MAKSRKKTKRVRLYIEHNPYTLNTNIKRNSKPLSINDFSPNDHIQEWMDFLPNFLRRRFPRRSFEIHFSGTTVDFIDLTNTLSAALNKKYTRVHFKHFPVQETSAKQRQINNLFTTLTDITSPFPSLLTQEVRAAFEHARRDEFEVCVVGTMSSGKSTLINALLGRKLMPCKQEACTAVVTRIRDEDARGESGFRGQAFNSTGNLVAEMPNLTADEMARLNDDPSVTTVEVVGDIPFVASEKISLVLVDTPGPNNARNQCHRDVQRAFLDKSSKSVILYVMTGQFGTDDDHTLLNRITRSMSVGGKQSRERFIFVVNKMDCLKKEDGDTAHTLQSIRNYLETHGIVNPSIFPVAALPAMNIRCQLAGIEQGEDEADETAFAIRKLNRTPEMHLDAYARRFTSLPTPAIDELDAQCRAYAEEWERRGGKPNADPREALIHSGIPVLEAAIRIYLEKYAYPAKIRTIAETLTHRLEEIEVQAETSPLDATELEFLELVRHQLKELLEL